MGHANCPRGVSRAERRVGVGWELGNPQCHPLSADRGASGACNALAGSGGLGIASTPLEICLCIEVCRRVCVCVYA